MRQNSGLSGLFGKSPNSMWVSAVVAFKRLVRKKGARAGQAKRVVTVTARKVSTTPRTVMIHVVVDRLLACFDFHSYVCVFYKVILCCRLVCVGREISFLFVLCFVFCGCGRLTRPVACHASKSYDLVYHGHSHDDGYCYYCFVSHVC